MPFETYHKVYTQCQLIASFLYVMGEISNLTVNNLRDIEGLQNDAKDLGDELCKLDEPNTWPTHPRSWNIWLPK
eukprot:scaffold2836_cov99-Cylindrotheca_fusiformis.AAC.11